MANTPLPVQVDYTSRDYQSLREDMIARVRARVPDWNPGDDPADFGLAIVEAMAYMGDLMSYYIDRAANESTLSTATRRASVVALARDLGYDAGGFTASTVVLTVTNSSGDDIEIPAGTVFTAIVESGDAVLAIPFETNDVAPLDDGIPTPVPCTQGETKVGTGYGEILGTSTGEPSQFFEVPDTNVVKNTVAVYVFDGVNFLPWQRVEHLSDYSSLSRVYSVIDNGDDSVFVEFGDGVSGLIPSTSHVVYAQYRVVDGINGNVPAGAITELTSVPGLSAGDVSILQGSISVINDVAATGGTDPEELESIRRNATQAYRTNERAVALDDYQSVALKVPICGKASAMASTPGQVVVAIAPYRNTGAAEAYPGFVEDDPDEWVPALEIETIIDAVEGVLVRAKMAGTQITVIPPTYLYMTLEVTVDVLDHVRQADALVIIKQAILDRLDYARASFGASVIANDIIALVASLGVAAETEVDELWVNDSDDGNVVALQADDDQLLLIREEGLTINLTGGLA